MLGYEKVMFMNPAELSTQGVNVDGFGKKFANYTKIDENGYPKENTKITMGDVYLGKCVVKTEYVEDDSETSIFKSKKKNETFRDKSSVANKNFGGTVDKVYVHEKNDGKKTCKIRMRKWRNPVLGDKHGSSHAQKGVIGMIVPHENMPYTKDGIVPDLIINPHAIPTRMTIAHLIECVLSKLGCIEGKYYDATPFCNQDIEGAYENLQHLGYERNGNELMYNGITGEQMSCEIFIGPTYYMRFKHMVEDKLNAREREGANYTGLTRQPVKARSNEGGLRIGEMETGSILAHGLGSFMKESMMERSDKYSYYIDKKSGDVAIYNDKQNFARSSTDPYSTEFSHIETPFATKLLFQELETMAIIPRVITDNQDDYEDFQEDYTANVYAGSDEEENEQNILDSLD